MRRYIVFILLISLISCSKHDPHESDFNIEKIDSTSEEIYIPISLWDEVEKVGHAQKSSEAVGIALKKYINIDVTLESKNPGIVKREKVLIQFPRGGGVLDLGRYLSDKNGSFYMNFKPDLPEEVKDFNVFFVSHGRKRRIEGHEIWGLGCRSYANLSKFWSGLDSHGVKLNTTMVRHVSVGAGSYIFASQTPHNELLLAQVTVEDSRYPQYHCSRGKETNHDEAVH